MNSFNDVIEMWPKPFVRTFANDIGVSEWVVAQMRARNSIAAHRFSSVVKAAKSRGLSGVTYKTLADLAEKKYRETENA